MRLKAVQVSVNIAYTILLLTLGFAGGVMFADKSVVEAARIVFAHNASVCVDKIRTIAMFSYLEGRRQGCIDI